MELLVVEERKGGYKAIDCHDWHAGAEACKQDRFAIFFKTCGKTSFGFSKQQKKQDYFCNHVQATCGEIGDQNTEKLKFFKF